MPRAGQSNGPPFFIMNISIIIPSRGILLSRMKESIDNEILTVGCNASFYYSHGLSIPDCFNIPTEKALSNKLDYIWYIEEDIIVPRGGLQAMLELSKGENNGMIAINYLLRHYGGLSEGWYREGRRPKIRTWVGLGCTLVRRDVFSKIREMTNKPFFKPAKLITRHGGSATKRKILTAVECNRKYGGQDIYFCHLVRMAGFNICACDDLLAEHLNIPTVGNGCP